ncbi:MAG: GIY-YIG nuclease family protein [Gammaproteobacteria bacterium]
MRREPGTYVLVLACSRAGTVAVGRAGTLALAPGSYLYVGSAFGPGGVAARVGRHARINDRRHWHIDYLRPHLDLEEAWYSHDAERHEHAWAAIMPALGGIEVPGVGSSDCACSTHLFRFGAAPDLARFRRRARAAGAALGPIRRWAYT